MIIANNAIKEEKPWKTDTKNEDIYWMISDYFT